MKHGRISIGRAGGESGFEQSPWTVSGAELATHMLLFLAYHCAATCLFSVRGQRRANDLPKVIQLDLKLGQKHALELSP